VPGTESSERRNGMAAIAQQPAESSEPDPLQPRARGRSRPKVRSEGVRIEASRAAVYDVLVDPAARGRWLGSFATVEHAALAVTQPRVRLPIEAWPAPNNGRPSLPSVTLHVLRPDGAAVGLTFILHAVPFATVVELQHRVLRLPNPRRRTSGWRASHWRRHCLEALRREVEGRAPKQMARPRRAARRAATPPARRR